jgi:hypothetical protein
VSALLDPARDQHVPVDAEEVVAVEARFPDFLQRADRLRSRRYRQRVTPIVGNRLETLSPHPDRTAPIVPAEVRV